MDATHSKTPLKAIRLKCLECSNGSSNDVKECEIDSCELFHFRLGKNPYRVKRVLTDEQKSKLSEQLARGRQRQKDNREA